MSLNRLMEEMNSRVLGQELNVRLLVTALLAGGHVLLEGAPGLGKTRMVATLAGLLAGQFRRVQFTPDMMPADITGSVVYNMRANEFETVKGPVFANMLLADEINRTPPKTQAALLEAMEERQTTIQGRTWKLPDPFFVAATQNPVEYEGTYPLPEAQLDRFMFKLVVDYPDREREADILRLHRPYYLWGQEQQAGNAEGAAEENPVSRPEAPEGGASSSPPGLNPVCDMDVLRSQREAAANVKADDSILLYITDLMRHTRESAKLQLGASPRAGLAVLMASKAWALLEGRDFITPDDVKMVVRPALRHRLILAPQTELEGGASDQVIQEALVAVPVPR